MLSLYDEFRRNVWQDPAAPSIQDADGVLTRAEVERRAGELAARLRAAGGARRLVGVATGRGAATAVAILGVDAAGSAYLPLDTAQPAARLATVIGDAAPACVLATRRTAPLLPPDVPVLLVDDGAPAAADPPCRLADDTGGELAYVMYTSGSTGVPKGVAIRRSGLATYFAALDRELGTAPGQVWLWVSSISFDSSVAELVWSLVRGQLVRVADSSALGLLESPLATGDAPRVTHVQCTPSLVRLLAADPGTLAGLRRLRVLLVGGEPFPADLVPLLRPGGSGPRLVNVYGPTETTVWVACCDVTEQSPRPVPVGDPIPGVRLAVLDDRLEPVPVGRPGRLFVLGGSLAAGYWRRPDLTAAWFRRLPGSGERAYDTGDVAVRLPHGTVVLGRADGQVKVRGHRVELGEVEAVLRADPEVRDAACVVDDEHGFAAELTAFVVAGDGFDEAAVQDRLRGQLPHYMVPTQLLPVDGLPLTAAGKVDRRRLRAQLPASADVGSPA